MAFNRMNNLDQANQNIWNSDMNYYNSNAWPRFCNVPQGYSQNICDTRFYNQGFSGTAASGFSWGFRGQSHGPRYQNRGFYNRNVNDNFGYRGGCNRFNNCNFGRPNEYAFVEKPEPLYKNFVNNGINSSQNNTDSVQDKRATFAIDNTVSMETFPVPHDRSSNEDKASDNLYNTNVADYVTTSSRQTGQFTPREDRKEQDSWKSKRTRRRKSWSCFVPRGVFHQSNRVVKKKHRHSDNMPFYFHDKKIGKKRKYGSIDVEVGINQDKADDVSESGEVVSECLDTNASTKFSPRKDCHDKCPKKTKKKVEKWLISSRFSEASVEDLVDLGNGDQKYLMMENGSELIISDLGKNNDLSVNDFLSQASEDEGDATLSGKGSLVELSSGGSDKSLKPLPSESMDVIDVLSQSEDSTLPYSTCCDIEEDDVLVEMPSNSSLVAGYFGTNLDVVRNISLLFYPRFELNISYTALNSIFARRTFVFRFGTLLHTEAAFLPRYVALLPLVSITLSYITVDRKISANVTQIRSFHFGHFGIKIVKDSHSKRFRTECSIENGSDSKQDPKRNLSTTPSIVSNQREDKSSDLPLVKQQCDYLSAKLQPLSARTTVDFITHGHDDQKHTTLGYKRNTSGVISFLEHGCPDIAAEKAIRYRGETVTIEHCASKTRTSNDTEADTGTSYKYEAKTTTSNQYVDQKGFKDSSASKEAFIYSPASKEAFIDSPASKEAFIDSPASKEAFIDSPASKETFIDSPASKEAFIDSQASKEAFIDSPASKEAFIDSPASKEAFIDSPASKETFIDSPASKETFIDSPASNVAFIDSPASNVAFIDSPASNVAFIDSSTSKVALIDSSASKVALIDSSTSKEALIDSPASKEAFIDSPASKEAFIDSPASKEAFIDSPASKEAFIDSPASKETFIDSPASKETFIDSPASNVAFIDSPASNVAFIDSSASKGALIDSSASKGALIDSSASKGALIDSSASKGALIDSSASKGALIDSSASKGALIDSSASKEALIDSLTSKGALIDSSASKGALIDSSASKGALIDSSASKGALIDSSASKVAPIDSSASKVAPIDSSASKVAPIDSSASKVAPIDSPASNVAFKDSSASKEVRCDYATHISGLATYEDTYGEGDFPEKHDSEQTVGNFSNDKRTCSLLVVQENSYGGHDDCEEADCNVRAAEETGVSYSGTILSAVPIETVTQCAVSLPIDKIDNYYCYHKPYTEIDMSVVQCSVDTVSENHKMGDNVTSGKHTHDNCRCSNYAISEDPETENGKPEGQPFIRRTPPVRISHLPKPNIVGSSIPRAKMKKQDSLAKYARPTNKPSSLNEENKLDKYKEKHPKKRYVDQLSSSLLAGLVSSKSQDETVDNANDAKQETLSKSSIPKPDKFTDKRGSPRAQIASTRNRKRGNVTPRKRRWDAAERKSTFSSPRDDPEKDRKVTPKRPTRWDETETRLPQKKRTLLPTPTLAPANSNAQSSSYGKWPFEHAESVPEIHTDHHKHARRSSKRDDYYFIEVIPDLFISCHCKISGNCHCPRRLAEKSFAKPGTHPVIGKIEIPDITCNKNEPQKRFDVNDQEQTSSNFALDEVHRDIYKQRSDSFSDHVSTEPVVNNLSRQFAEVQQADEVRRDTYRQRSQSFSPQVSTETVTNTVSRQFSDVHNVTAGELFGERRNSISRCNEFYPKNALSGTSDNFDNNLRLIPLPGHPNTIQVDELENGNAVSNLDIPLRVENVTQFTSNQYVSTTISSQSQNIAAFKIPESDKTVSIEPYFKSNDTVQYPDKNVNASRKTNTSRNSSPSVSRQTQSRGCSSPKIDLVRNSNIASEPVTRCSSTSSSWVSQSYATTELNQERSIRQWHSLDTSDEFEVFEEKYAPLSATEMEYQSSYSTDNVIGKESKHFSDPNDNISIIERGDSLTDKSLFMGNQAVDESLPSTNRNTSGINFLPIFNCPQIYTYPQYMADSFLSFTSPVLSTPVVCGTNQCYVFPSCPPSDQNANHQWVDTSKAAQTLPYSSPNEVQMGTDHDSELAEDDSQMALNEEAVPVPRMVYVSETRARDPRLRRIRNSVSESNEAEVITVKSLGMNVSANPQSYTTWKTPKKVSGIRRPVYKRPRKIRNPSSSVMEIVIVEDPRLKFFKHNKSRDTALKRNRTVDESSLSKRPSRPPNKGCSALKKIAEEAAKRLEIKNAKKCYKDFKHKPRYPKLILPEALDPFVRLETMDKSFISKFTKDAKIGKSSKIRNSPQSPKSNSSKFDKSASKSVNGKSNGRRRKADKCLSSTKDGNPSRDSNATREHISTKDAKRNSDSHDESTYSKSRIRSHNVKMYTTVASATDLIQVQNERGSLAKTAIEVNAVQNGNNDSRVLNHDISKKGSNDKSGEVPDFSGSCNYLAPEFTASRDVTNTKGILKSEELPTLTPYVDSKCGIDPDLERDRELIYQKAKLRGMKARLFFLREKRDTDERTLKLKRLQIEAMEKLIESSEYEFKIRHDRLKKETSTANAKPSFNEELLNRVSSESNNLFEVLKNRDRWNSLSIMQLVKFRDRLLALRKDVTTLTKDAAINLNVNKNFVLQVLGDISSSCEFYLGQIEAALFQDSPKNEDNIQPKKEFVEDKPDVVTLDSDDEEQVFENKVEPKYKTDESDGRFNDLHIPITINVIKQSSSPKTPRYKGNLRLVPIVKEEPLDPVPRNVTGSEPDDISGENVSRETMEYLRRVKEELSESDEEWGARRTKRTTPRRNAATSGANLAAIIQKMKKNGTLQKILGTDTSCINSSFFSSAEK